MRQPTPHTTPPIRRGNMVIISKIGPTIVVGSANAQGSKVKPINGPEPRRAIRARDEAIQRMANILAYPVHHRGDPMSLNFISKSGPGGFLQAPLWTGILLSGFTVWIT
jgi:hypothetical protein